MANRVMKQDWWKLTEVVAWALTASLTIVEKASELENIYDVLVEIDPGVDRWQPVLVDLADFLAEKNTETRGLSPFGQSGQTQKVPTEVWKRLDAQDPLAWSSLCLEQPDEGGGWYAVLVAVDCVLSRWPLNSADMVNATITRGRPGRRPAHIVPRKSNCLNACLLELRSGSHPRAMTTVEMAKLIHLRYEEVGEWDSIRGAIGPTMREWRAGKCVPEPDGEIPPRRG
jgi:hypothetical protein